MIIVGDDIYDHKQEFDQQMVVVNPRHVVAAWVEHEDQMEIEQPFICMRIMLLGGHELEIAYATRSRAREALNKIWLGTGIADGKT